MRDRLCTTRTTLPSHEMGRAGTPLDGTRKADRTPDRSRTAARPAKRARTATDRAPRESSAGTDVGTGREDGACDGGHIVTISPALLVTFAAACVCLPGHALAAESAASVSFDELVEHELGAG